MLKTTKSKYNFTGDIMANLEIKLDPFISKTYEIETCSQIIRKFIHFVNNLLIELETVWDEDVVNKHENDFEKMELLLEDAIVLFEEISHELRERKKLFDDVDKSICASARFLK